MAFIEKVRTDKRLASKAAWLIYVYRTVMMSLMFLINRWPTWVGFMLGLHLVVLTFLTFYPKTPVRLQSAFMMLFFFGNVLMSSVMEETIYPALFLFLAAAMVLAVYMNVRLLLVYSVLIAGAVLYHVLVLHSVPFDTSVQVVDFIVWVTILFIAIGFLMGFLSQMNRSGRLMEQSVASAQRAEQYKSDFLANMSHEIRTPMNAIIGMCELVLREDSLSGSARENCFNIQASGRSLLSIINDILDYSKIDSGKMEIVNEEFNIASLVNDVINMSEARKGTKDLKLLVDVDPNIPRGLMGDETRIRQVTLNLMTNAIKFTREGSVTLRLSCSRQEYGINLVVSVKDTGIGIAEENLENLFTSFQQLDTKKNRAVEGTGLGLAISKRLVTKMGGFISVRSEYGVGSEFRFVIPLSVSDDRPFVAVRAPETIHAVACFEESKYAQTEGRLFTQMGGKLGVDFRYMESLEELKSHHAAHKPTHIFVGSREHQKDGGFFADAVNESQIFVIQDRAENPHLPDNVQRVYSPFYVIPVVSAINHENIVLSLNERRDADIHFTAPKAKVLLVDDNAINLKVALGLMQPYNMKIMTATSGPEAIRMLESEDFDLVFMDHMMPEMDGVEATAILRAKEGEYYRKLPIVALTANVANDARTMFLSSGFNDFLAKPIELSSLNRILKNYIPREYQMAPERSAYTGPERRKARRVTEKKEVLLDTERGIAYMGGSEDIYREILSLYAHEGPGKRELIRKYAKSGELKNFVVEVHALKSTSMSVGAVDLSELAKSVEAAGKAGRLDKARTKELLELYSRVIERAAAYLEENPAAKTEEAAPELTEISEDQLRGYLTRAIEAARGFDSDGMGAVAEETDGLSFDGKALKDAFGKAARLAADFEYEAAEKELEELRSKLNT